MEKVGVLFICMGNICRSPTAQGVFEERVREAALEDRFRIDSAGTHAYHIGNSPDARSVAAAERRGYDLSRQRARRIHEDDFEQFEYVLVMDRANLEIVDGLCPPPRRERVRLFMEFAPHMGMEEVPDPYYGGAAGFERVLDMVEAASEGLLSEVRERHRHLFGAR